MGPDAILQNGNFILKTMKVSHVALKNKKSGGTTLSLLAMDESSETVWDQGDTTILPSFSVLWFSHTIQSYSRSGTL